jgi:hypothetical protein
MSDMTETWQPIGSENRSVVSSATVLIKCDRLRVPGGWIVRTIAAMGSLDAASIHVTQTFVPDEARDSPLRDRVDQFQQPLAVKVVP